MLSMVLAVLLHCTDTSWPQYGGPAGTFTATHPIRAGEWNILWRQPLGQGTSGIVSDGRLLFTMGMRLKAGSKTEGDELVVAHDLTTGQRIWEQAVAIKRLNKQESFSGDPVRPQATPALHRGVLCTLGYTGILTGWQAETGKLLWRIDLVNDLGARPVQFGFSASPLIYRDDFVMHTGGSTSLIRVDPLTGRVKWKAEPGEPGYATPIMMRLQGEEHLVQVTRDAILGIHPETGMTLWRYAMPEAGLTNVPAPLALKGDRLLVSGQGIKGTRMLQCNKAGERWEIKELWHNSKVTFFYCNWTATEDAVYGNANKILLGLSLVDGKELWRERGYAECNVLQTGKDHVVVDGNGNLSRCEMSLQGVKQFTSMKIMQSRCWTAPSLVGNVLLLRDQEELVAVSMGR